MDAIAGVILGAVDGAAAGPMVALAVDNPIDLALQWIGFENAATRDRLRDEGFSEFEDLKSLRKKILGTWRSPMGDAPKVTGALSSVSVAPVTSSA